MGGEWRERERRSKWEVDEGYTIIKITVPV